MLHVLLPVCNQDSNGRTSGMYRKTDLTQNERKRQNLTHLGLDLAPPQTPDPGRQEGGELAGSGTHVKSSAHLTV